MSHPFQEGVGGRDASPFPKRGGWTVMIYPKGGTREEEGSTNQNQGERVGADYVNESPQNTVSPRTVLISKSWGQSPCPTTRI